MPDGSPKQLVPAQSASGTCESAVFSDLNEPRVNQRGYCLPAHRASVLRSPGRKSTCANHIQTSLESEERVVASHRSETTMRWTCKAEMELVLRAAELSHWQICGDLDGRPLTGENDIRPVHARKE